jgi:predicted dehydrogenase
MLLPRLKEDGRFFLQAVVSRDPVRGGNLARTERAPIQASELSEVVAQPEIDLLVIATRHAEHAAQVSAALDAGKHVFVEKPLALSWEELRTVADAYEKRADGAVLMVGYNRRFSPALRALSGALAERTSPLVVTYRVNAGYLPLDHWVQGPDGGGRNLGEACHMYDVFRFLVGVPVESITANAIASTPGVYLSSDNFVATLTYEDGSVCNLVYTALGPKEGLPKERIEVFSGGQAYLVDDFRRLERCGDGSVLWSGETDKGHAEEIRRLGQALCAGDPDPIPYEELLETSVVSLAVDDMIRAGNG